ncbi:hypothetical protein AMECASPLE_036975 [Ameca splendens]|uniref:Uncharacterized protein n=1 Tax=Ameca splendens TaxID=208324 RepID=A0ABV0Z5N9_9TELE
MQYCRESYLNGSHGKIFKLLVDFKNLRDTTHDDKKIKDIIGLPYSVWCAATHHAQQTTHKQVSLTNIRLNKFSKKNKADHEETMAIVSDWLIVTFNRLHACLSLEHPTC